MRPSHAKNLGLRRCCFQLENYHVLVNTFGVDGDSFGATDCAHLCENGCANGCAQLCENACVNVCESGGAHLYAKLYESGCTSGYTSDSVNGSRLGGGSVCRIVCAWRYANCWMTCCAGEFVNFPVNVCVNPSLNGCATDDCAASDHCDFRGYVAG